MLSGEAKGASGGVRPGEHAGLGGTSMHFIQTFKKRVFLQKFRPKYAKNLAEIRPKYAEI